MTNSNGPTPETDPVTEDLTEENLEIVSGGGAGSRYTYISVIDGCRP
jgi:hypothetical protein